MVAGSSPSVLNPSPPLCFLSNFYHVIEFDDDDNDGDDDDDDGDEFRFNDATIHEGHLRQNSILIWFFIEKGKSYH